MNDKEREVFSYMVKEKYKYYKVWKTLAVVFMCISAILAILYFSSGYVFTSRIIECDNNVEIENDGNNNENSNNGNIVIEKQNDSTGGCCHYFFNNIGWRNNRWLLHYFIEK